ncbi:hypothetical protein D0866_15148 [Hortaea werneckii]|uniref:Hyaluronan/mRNA-binding protein domain-containing protein n=1 Tax=Hortaea werneckii TaxID=91943 RepID=A0A3M6YSK0_HORWE|nr:hypothetical protein D0866_15148 [Hortaea werneckii]
MGTPRIVMANAGGRIETYYVPYLTCSEPLLYRLMISSQLPALASATAAPLPLHRMTRTHKGNDRDHVGLANGTAVPEEHLPRYFGKAGFAGTNPAETKKKGSGKGNWGQAGISELEDFDYNSLKPRRRSNSMSMAAGHSALKTKFEAVDDDVAIEFDEALHGPREEDMVDNNLEKMSSSSSADTMGSIEEEMDGAASAASAAGQKK